MTIDDITPYDLDVSPIWYFPFDDDETIEPMLKQELIHEYPFIIKTIFIDCSSNIFIGYIHYSAANIVNRLLPYMFIDDTVSSGIYFWNGMFEPKDDDLSLLKKHCNLPISYQSQEVFGIKPLSGILYGIYYRDQNKNILFK